MSLVQPYGKPDLFITMTCNVNWPEIKNELAVGEETQNRPDLVAKIFCAKLLALKKHIMEKQVFGDVAAIVYIVEFQKWGLPHAHMLIILKPAFKIKCPTHFDRFICAEIPTQDNPHLRKSILKHMMHGPCGHLNPRCPCMKHLKSKGSCKYVYPKQFRIETTNNGDGYPMYKRRYIGDSASIRKATLDNRWVIPYNPCLSSLFDCHLNVEVCSTIEAVKYLYKYVYKGHDKISFNVVHKGEVDTIDEIEHYQSGRCTKLFIRRIHRAHRWDLSSKEWVKRKNKVIVIGRLTFVAPTEGERYFLRLLLLNIRGPRSFEDLLTVYGCRCASFQEAAIKLRLLEEDDAIDKCLAKACEVQMPPAIRRLFSTVLIFCQPSEPNALFMLPS
ncbi:uncharacterized protein LOC130589903 [Beta vulgaris subsp. vulgaris]|uniref:uncharacterized protein LOC130589903 n=1 Tax=Beta vulgaris subsp. vulgaris TaxID=3555 RepID=UPI002549A805|nr:uncharacterized protein LOC130589903 [Beta vulgaris subsp. vulgaris]